MTRFVALLFAIGARGLAPVAVAPSPVAVYDGVFAAADLKPLDAGGNDGHRVCRRGDRAGTILEAALDSVLTELGDESPYIEYWARAEWMHLAAHSDVDEYLQKRSGELRHPNFGHVLYIDVGDEVRGPTCVFAGDQLISVPAVAGRVLRFEGDLAHAVPEPSDVWFRSFVSKQPHTPARRRSVVLFNTWDEPPLDVPLEPPFSIPFADAPVKAQRKNSWAPVLPLATAEVGDRVAGKLPRLGTPARRGGLPRFRNFEATAGLLDALRDDRNVWETRLREPS